MWLEGLGRPTQRSEEVQVIDTETEELIPLKQLGLMFPGRAGKAISRATLFRWMLKGVKGHKLESLLIGGKRVSSRQAVARFLDSLNPGACHHRTGEAEAVAKVLDAEGL